MSAAVLETHAISPGPGPEAALHLGAVAAPSAETCMAAILAGARARGVADTLDMLGIAAVLIGADGAALHVNTEAAAYMGVHFGICAGQLVASTFDANAGLQRALDHVLAHGGAETVQIADIALHLLSLPGAGDDSCQLLKAIVVLERQSASCGEMALAARLLRQSARLN
jgi:hypothetical protein